MPKRTKIVGQMFAGGGRHALTLECGHVEFRMANPAWKAVGGSVLCHTCNPIPVTSLAPRKHLINKLVQDVTLLHPVERREFISKLGNLFCMYCGSSDPGCQCWNDE